MPSNMIATFTVTGDKALADALRGLGARAPAAAASALLTEAERIMTRSKRLAPADIGALRTSGHVKPPVVTRTSASVTMGYGGASAPYAVWVHEGIGPAVGRPPFTPPAENFIPWARRVLHDEGAAFPVARAVGRKGIKPTKFLERPLKEAMAGMPARLAKRLNATLIKPTQVTGSRVARQLTKGRVRRRFYY